MSSVSPGAATTTALWKSAPVPQEFSKKATKHSEWSLQLAHHKEHDVVYLHTVNKFQSLWQITYRIPSLMQELAGRNITYFVFIEQLPRQGVKQL
jgi:hypothetical protein